MTERADTFIASLGFESYRVGGSVRDEVLGRKAKDADYMVRGVSLSDLGKKLSWEAGFKAVSPLTLRDGRQAGWRVAVKGMGLIEVVLPRTEVSTGPGHRDFEIVVDPNLTLSEDAVRRDFTFNALYKKIPLPGEGTSLLTIEGGRVLENVIDPLGGIADLLHRRINTTHPNSFRDDPLRTLRALRFISTLGYDLSRETWEQMCDHADAVTGLSAKGYASGTVFDEFSKLLMGQDPVQALRVARDSGVLAVALPELAPMLGFDQGSRYHDMTTDEHTFTALAKAAHVDAPLRVRWALLFHDAGKPESAWVGDDGRKHYYAAKRPCAADPHYEITTEDHEVVGESIWLKAAYRLNVPREMRRDVATLIREHMVPAKTRNLETRVARMRVKFGDEMLHDLLLHRACDVTAKGTPKQNKGDLQHIVNMETTRVLMEQHGVPKSAKDLQIGGRDLIAMGCEGRSIGAVLARVLDEVICRRDEQAMTREWQMSRAEALAR